MNDRRIALCIRYDGHDYHGWQIQRNLVTIQEKVESALSRVANHPVQVYCAGRTDAGVHATAQIVHFDTKSLRSEHAWKCGANTNLPADISVSWVKEVSPHFHARYSAKSRRYRYVIYNHDTRPGILRNAVGWYYRPLNIEKMQEAANYLVGQHDFSAFRGAGCQSHSPIREIYQIDIYREGLMVIIEVHGNAFLLHMVRNITGVLVLVGCGEKSPEWAQEVLDSKDRKRAGITITPKGLYLIEIEYPPVFELPLTPKGPFFLV